MFIQIIQGKVHDAELWKRQGERWMRELKPGAEGYLGYTGGLTPDGRSIELARFESAEAARANSSRAEQDAWWNETAKAYDGEPTFHDCTDITTMFGGGSNDAGFVQVIQGRTKDRQAMQEMAGPELEAELRRERPDILGMVFAWHGDSADFTQVVYFRNEQETRSQEAASASSETRERYMSMFDGEPRFYDLPDPLID